MEWILAHLKTTVQLLGGVFVGALTTCSHQPALVACG